LLFVCAVRACEVENYGAWVVSHERNAHVIKGIICGDNQAHELAEHTHTHTHTYTHTYLLLHLHLQCQQLPSSLL